MMSNEFNCSEETVLLVGLRSWASLHRVPAQTVELKNDHIRSLQRILMYFIFAIKVRNNGSSEHLCFQKTPW